MAREARSLAQLLAEVNERAPERDKASDGWIADQAHASRVSDHNPDGQGIVRARDFDDDPAGGHDASVFAEFLRLSRDDRLKYVIDQGAMFSSYATSSYPAWTWRPYTGVNAHKQHTHVSVVADDRADDPRPWGWATHAGGAGMIEGTIEQGDKGPTVRYWQRRANRVLTGNPNLPLKDDGTYGATTAKAFAEALGRDKPVKSLGPVFQDNLEARVAAAMIRRALTSVPSAKIDLDKLAKEVADELTVVPR